MGPPAARLAETRPLGGAPVFGHRLDAVGQTARLGALTWPDVLATAGGRCRRSHGDRTAAPLSEARKRRTGTSRPKYLRSCLQYVRRGPTDFLQGLSWRRLPATHQRSSRADGDLKTSSPRWADLYLLPVTGRSMRPACDKCVKDLSDPVVHQCGRIIWARSCAVRPNSSDMASVTSWSISVGRQQIRQDWVYQRLEVGNGHERIVLTVGFAGSVSRASRSAMRRSWKRRLERAALSRSSRVRLSAVS